MTPDALRPNILYKYIRAEGGIELLTKQEHWLKNPMHFDDRFDCRADLFVGLDTNETQACYLDELVRFFCGPEEQVSHPHPDAAMLRTIREQGRPWTRENVLARYAATGADGFSNIGRLRDRFRRGSEQLIGTLRVLCLTESPSNAFMWDNYASSGTGVCIGVRHDPGTDSCVGKAHPVQYFKSWPPIASPREWARELAAIEQIRFGEAARQSILWKLDPYQDEAEWRCVVLINPEIGHDDGVYYRVPIEPDEITEVLLGPNLSSEQEAVIRAAVDEYHAGVPIRRV